MTAPGSRLATTRALPREALLRSAAALCLESLGFEGLQDLCRRTTAAHAPWPVAGRDPREDLPIAYSEARATRPIGRQDGCPVCDEETCPACDVVDLPVGAAPDTAPGSRHAAPGPPAPGHPGPDQAWFTPNLYPIAWPFPRGPAPDSTLRGIHLVQWSTRHHDLGLPGNDAARAAATFAQLARAEAFLLHAAQAPWPDSGRGDDGRGHRGHCGLVKNRGRRVGGSVEHDHQQLLFVDRPFAEPPRTRALAEALLAEAAPARVVDDVDGLALTLVPSFMRRPLHAFIVPRLPAGRDGTRRAPRAGWLHHLPEGLRDALALAVARLAHAVSAEMTRRAGEPAWNLILHTGEGCAPLVELRPYTQPFGGYEQLGLYLCEERPETSAARLRAALPG